MKKVGVLFLFLCILSGCAKADRELERGMALRFSLLQGNGVRFQAEITADYGDKLHSFGVACQADSKGNLQFEVTAPETIQGITGSVSGEGGHLTFEEVALQFASMADGQITPVMSPWVFLKTLRGGYLTSACMEENLLHLTIDDSYEDDALQLDIWVNEANAPVRAEILYDGRRILTLDVKDFVIL